MRLLNRKIYSFFYSQYFSDGLRITLGILLPALLFNQLNQLNIGVTLSLGAICVSVVDSPGPMLYKRNSMIFCCLLLFVVSLITGFVQYNPFFLGLEVVLFAFFFSMFAVYGNRASAIGTCALLIMIFMIEKRMQPQEVLNSSLLIFCGGVWYTLFSLLFFQIRPYRAAQQALGECIGQVAKYLRVKADFYAEKINIDENYKALVLRQIDVSQHQDSVREILFKTRAIVKESTHTSRMLILTFVDLIDLFDQINYTHYDYGSLRKAYSHTRVLEEISGFIHQMANELDEIGIAVQSNKKHKKLRVKQIELENLKKQIEQNNAEQPEKIGLFLNKILVNLRNVNQRLADMASYTSDISHTDKKQNSNLEFSRFVTHQDYAPRLFLENLSLKSASFKHALRVAIVCGIGFTLAKTVATGHHSYWILLTIIVILKPGFSLTKQRNFQRLIGTIVGGLIGVLILIFIHDKTVQFFIMLILMFLTYSFLRLNYVVSVIFMTPFVLIVFSFLGVELIHTAEERVFDTIIGSVLAFTSIFIILPNWEFNRLKESLGQVLLSNQNYLKTVVAALNGTLNTVEYKLVRKDVYVGSGNLSAAFERMISEPKSKQKHVKDIHKLVVLNHMLTSAIAAIATNLPDKNSIDPSSLLKIANNAQTVLKETIEKITLSTEKKINGFSIEAEMETIEISTETTNLEVSFLEDQLRFILKICTDISKVANAILD